MLVAMLWVIPRLMNTSYSVATFEEHGALSAPANELSEVHQKSIGPWGITYALTADMALRTLRPGTKDEKRAPPVREVPHHPPWSGAC